MELKDFTIGILTKALGLKADEAANLLEDPANGLKQALKVHADQVQELKTLASENFDDGYKKAEGEVRRKFERDLKAEFNLDTSAKGLDLVKEIVQSANKAEGNKVLSDDEVKKHPLFLKLEKDSKKAVDEVKSELETKIQEIEKGYQEKETFKTVEKKIASEISALKVALHKDPVKAEKQQSLIIKELKAAGYKFELKGESVLVLNPDGSRLEDEHGHSIPLQNLVKEKAEDLGFDFQASEERNSANAAGNSTSDEGRKKQVAVPKTEEEYAAKMFDQSLSTEEKLEIQAAWKESQGN